MEPSDFNKFCPVCGGELVIKSKELLTCTKCNHRKFINPVPAVSGIIMTSDNNVVIVERARPPEQGELDLPGGFLAINENLVEGLHRELKEELNFNSDLNKYIYLGSFIDQYTYKGICNYTIGVTYLINIDKKIDLIPNDDVANYKYMPLEDALKYYFPFSSIRKSFKVLGKYLQKY